MRQRVHDCPRRAPRYFHLALCSRHIGATVDAPPTVASTFYATATTEFSTAEFANPEPATSKPDLATADLATAKPAASKPEPAAAEPAASMPEPAAAKCSATLTAAVSATATLTPATTNVREHSSSVRMADDLVPLCG
jgi:hypothetical protein